MKILDEKITVNFDLTDKNYNSIEVAGTVFILIDSILVQILSFLIQFEEFYDGVRPFLTFFFSTFALIPLTVLVFYVSCLWLLRKLAIAKPELLAPNWKMIILYSVSTLVVTIFMTYGFTIFLVNTYFDPESCKLSFEKCQKLSFEKRVSQGYAFFSIIA
jgi:hypothetical protein